MSSTFCFGVIWPLSPRPSVLPTFAAINILLTGQKPVSSSHIRQRNTNRCSVSPFGWWGSSAFYFRLLAANSALAQLETATVSGQVSDPSGLSVSGAQVNLIDIDRDTTVSTKTNSSGLYTFVSVHPGRYRMEVRAAGFRVINFTDLTVNVQDHLEQNFRLKLVPCRKA